MAKKLLIGLILGVLLMVMGGLGVISYHKLPAPNLIWHLMQETGGASQSWRYLDAIEIPPADNKRPFVEKIRPLEISMKIKSGMVLSTKELLTHTKTRAFVVIQNGELVFEWYKKGDNRESIFTSFSVAKSFVSALMGIGMAEGVVPGLNSPVGKVIDELKGKSFYEKVTLKHLLLMKSGIDVDENYEKFLSPVAILYGTRDLSRFYKNTQGLRFKPGKKFEYRSVDTGLLGQALRQQYEEPLAGLLFEKIWNPMGAEYSASWSVDSKENKVEKAFCCINARAIDFAKFGQLYLNNGQMAGQQIIPSEWVEMSTKPLTGSDKWGYGFQWWVPKGGKDGDYSAIGVHGQYIYVNPRTNTVIAKFSDQKFEEDEGLTSKFLRKIARSF